MSLRSLLFVLVLMSVPMPAITAEVAGILVPDEARITGFDGVLLLNGAGVREKFFVDIYVGALYLPRRQVGVGRVLEEPPVNRVSMHFVYREVTRKKLAVAWREGFEKNLSAAQFAAVQARLERFSAMFGDMHAGDTVYLDYVPGRGTAVSINGVSKGTIDGHDFNSALLGVWMGESPVTESLKKAMVGVDKQ